MNLLALLIGLVIERLATQLFHLRRLRWLERLIDKGLAQTERFSRWPPLIPVLGLAIVLVLPVVAVTLYLGDALFGFPYLVLCVIVLFFSLGPNDIGEDIDRYCKALEAGDEVEIRQAAKSLVEGGVPEDEYERCKSVETAVVVQANNRLFAVIFWFVLLGPLGPLGAWGYRVTDLIRRRAVFNAARNDDSHAMPRDTAVQVHGWLAWIPARLTALGYATAGHFDAALSAWRSMESRPDATSSEASERLLAEVGIGALDLDEQTERSMTERGIYGARAANRLVFRLLMIWAFIIAAMTLYGWIS